MIGNSNYLVEGIIMKFIKLLSLVGVVFAVSSCASYQTDMNANVPNVNDTPLKNSMPPMSDTENTNMN